MYRYFAKQILDEYGDLVDYETPIQYIGMVSAPSCCDRFTGTIADYPKMELIEGEWQVVEDTVKKDREEAFAVSCVNAKAAAIGTDWNSLTAEQQKLISNIPLNDTEKDTVNSTWP